MICSISCDVDRGDQEGSGGWFSASWPSLDCIKVSSSAHTVAHHCTQCHYGFSQDQSLQHLSRSSLHTINIKCYTVVQCVPKVGAIVSVWPLMSPYSPPSELYGPQLCQHSVCSILYNSQNGIAVTVFQFNKHKNSSTCSKMCTLCRLQRHQN